MPIHKTKSGGWKWGKSGKTYKTRAGAERQMRAIYASGYMFIALLATNLLWAGFTVYLISKTSTDTTVTTEMTQDETNNNQSITNG